MILGISFCFPKVLILREGFNETLFHGHWCFGFLYCRVCRILQCSWNCSDLWSGKCIYHPYHANGLQLEIGKLVAASFLYRHWHTCNSQLRFYLSLAVVLLIGITSAGIYGYLSQAFEETLSQVEGFEKRNFQSTAPAK